MSNGLRRDSATRLFTWSSVLDKPGIGSVIEQCKVINNGTHLHSSWAVNVDIVGPVQISLQT